MNEQERFNYFASRQIGFKPKEEIVSFNNGLFSCCKSSQPVDVIQWERRMSYGQDNEECPNE